MSKDTAGKPKLSDTPYLALEKISRVREFGNKKYGDPASWTQVNPEDFYEAALRHLNKHMTAIRYGIGSVLDEESGLPHSWHALTSLILAEGNHEQQSK